MEGNYSLEEVVTSWIREYVAKNRLEGTVLIVLFSSAATERTLFSCQ